MKRKLHSVEVTVVYDLKKDNGKIVDLTYYERYAPNLTTAEYITLLAKLNQVTEDRVFINSIKHEFYYTYDAGKLV